MQRKTFAAWVLATTAATANAQSSVTLYGRVDAGIEYMSGIPAGNGSSQSRWRGESGNWGASLWGLKGAEDIGGGYTVQFRLEGSFNAMSGSGPGNNGLFNRRATVAVSNDQYGTFSLGREFLISNGLWDFDPFGQSTWSSPSLVGGRNWPVSSNSFFYQSPKFGGFDAYGQYSLSNASNWNGNGQTAQGRQDGLQLTYTATLFQIRGIYDEVRNPANGKFDDVFQYSREYFAAANVFLGPVRLSAAYQNSHASDAIAGAPSTTQLEWGGAVWQVTPDATLVAAIYHVNANNGAGNATIYTVGGKYNLSRRTLFDVQAATVRNSKTGQYSLEPNLGGNPDNPLAGHSQSGIYAGIQHSF